MYRLTGRTLEKPWVGSLDELLQANEDLSEVLRHRITKLKSGELLRLEPNAEAEIFVVECVEPESERGLTGGKMRRLLEGMAREIEGLQDMLNRRTIVIELDLSDYYEYRDMCPREDA